MVKVKYSMLLSIQLSVFTVMAAQSQHNILRIQKIRAMLILLLQV
jgi:hypothetical protein